MPMTTETMRAWKAGWEEVNRLEKEEMRNASPEEKMRQLSVMMVMARQMGWDRALAAEDEAVRERWNRLREIYGV